MMRENGWDNCLAISSIIVSVLTFLCKTALSLFKLKDIWIVFLNYID